MKIQGQIDIFDYIKENTSISPTCSNCVCRKCLYWWSNRCSYGECYDAKRAFEEPYDAAHPNKSPRKSWSDWNKPNEQKFWCRGGTFYPVKHCEKFVKYTGLEIQECVACNITIYQDGYVSCAIKECMTCEMCIEEQEGRLREQTYGCRYMTENGCESHIYAQSLLLDDILRGSTDEPCTRQCCIGCDRIGRCGYRCGRC